MHSMIVLALTLVLMWLNGCQVFSNEDLVRANSEIQAAVSEAVQAWEEFPKSLDRDRLLKHFSSDYSGVRDGANQSVKDLEESFNDLAEQIKLGAPLGISYVITELSIHTLSESLAWLTYQDETKLGRGGVLVQNVKSRCSALVRKEIGGWKVFHEHCSTVNG